MKSSVKIAAIAAAAVITCAGPALAHENRRVGADRLTVGWLVEPPYAGAPNAVSVGVDNAGPVTGASLQVVVIFGGRGGATRTDPIVMQPSDETPGTYTAAIVPTRPGTYTFHVTGTTGGERVDQYFTSGDKTFDDIESPAADEFPVKDPSAADLVSRVNRSDEAARTASGRAQRASLLGIVAVVVAAYGLVRGRRSS